MYCVLTLAGAAQMLLVCLLWKPGNSRKVEEVCMRCLLDVAGHGKHAALPLRDSRFRP